MAVSTTATFSLDIDDVLDEAFNRVGSKTATGYDVHKAKRALGLLFYELQARNINLWHLEEATPLALTEDTPSYVLDADTVDILHGIMVADTSESDPREIPVERCSLDEYQAISNKLTDGRPSMAYLHRGRDAPTLYVYPVPNSDDYELRYWRLVKPRDPGPLTNQPDAPVKWLPALISGVAWFLARGNPVVPLDLRNQLKAEWDSDFEIAAGEDRDASPMTLEVDLSYINRPFR